MDEETRLRIEGNRVRDARRFSQEAMHTVFEVYVLHPDERYAAQAAAAAFALTTRLERDLSRFIANSDITRINHLVAGEATRVAPHTMECLVIARHMFELTGGAFDVSVGTGLPSLDLDEDEVVVRATSDGVRLDLGGIGKGYAVDLMAEVLEEWGLEAALVHGGFSSILALEGPAAGQGWPLTLSDPARPSRVLARVSLRQTAMGASGLLKGDHIVDPRSGTPVQGRRAAWVAAPRPVTARHEVHVEGTRRLAVTAVTDALTTASMVMGMAEIAALCASSPGLEAWVLADHEGGLRDAELLHFGGIHEEGPVALETGDA